MNKSAGKKRHKSITLKKVKKNSYNCYFFCIFIHLLSILSVFVSFSKKKIQNILNQFELLGFKFCTFIFFSFVIQFTNKWINNFSNIKYLMNYKVCFKNRQKKCLRNRQKQMENPKKVVLYPPVTFNYILMITSSFKLFRQTLVPLILFLIFNQWYNVILDI